MINSLSPCHFIFKGRPGFASGDYFRWLSSGSSPIRLASRQLRRCIVDQRRLNRSLKSPDVVGQGGTNV